MKAALYTKDGKKKRELVLNPEIYAARVNQRLLEIVHKAYSANLRHGTASTKERSEVRGGGRKPWKQKGTGRARHGTIRSPIWRGGGTTFGPWPRSYNVALPKQMKKKALISALSLRGSEKSVMVLEDVSLETAKTREWADVVKALPLQGKKAICVVKDVETNLKRASQNLHHRMVVVKADELNAFHILQREKIVIAENALSILEDILMKKRSGDPTETPEKEGAVTA